MFAVFRFQIKDVMAQIFPYYQIIFNNDTKFLKVHKSKIKYCIQ